MSTGQKGQWPEGYVLKLSHAAVMAYNSLHHLVALSSL